MRRVLQAIFSILRARRMEEDLNEQIASHLGMLAEEHMGAGMEEADAWAAARREFGGIEQVREAHREQRTFAFASSIGADVRYASRAFVRSPGFTAAVVLTLALGIGGNTAIFSVMDALLLRPLPVRDPQQLMEFLNMYPGEPGGNGFSPQSYENYRNRNHAFSGVFGDSGQSRTLIRIGNREPETGDADYVTGTLFPVLGVSAAAGRLIGPDDDRSGAAAVAVISWSYWKSRFDLDPAITGKQIEIADAPVTIIGVADREFSGMQMGSHTDVWLPVSNRTTGGPMSLRLMARLKPGATVAQAQAEMNVLYRSTLDEMAQSSRDPLIRQMRMEVRSAAGGLSTRLRDQLARPLTLLMALVGLLLLIACIHIAGMLLARGASRRREMAVRISLGAGRMRLARQALTEAMALATAGSAAGAAVAWFLTATLVRILATGRDGLHIPVQPDARVLLFTVLVTLFTGLLFGLAPAITAFGAAPVTSMRDNGRSGQTRGARLFGRSLVAAQVAFSMALLGAAGLFIGHLADLEHFDAGFRRDHILLVTLDPPHSGVNGEEFLQREEQLLRRLEAIPGVRSATLSAVTPLSGAAGASFVEVEGHPDSPGARRYVSLNAVAPRYFETFGTPLLEGRDFSPKDRGAARVGIINRAMAQYYFGQTSAIGKHVTLPSRGTAPNPPYEIVGVVGDASYAQIRETPPRTLYSNVLQQNRAFPEVALRTRVPPLTVAEDARRAVRETLQSAAVVKVRTLEDQVNASIMPERLVAMLAALFGSLAAALVAVGIYGALSYTVSRRLNEIGVRMAVGATRGDVIWMVAGDAVTIVSSGLAFGIPLTWWGMRLARGMMADLPRVSWFPVLSGGLAVLMMALAATYGPTWRAVTTDPAETLRYE